MSAVRDSEARRLAQLRAIQAARRQLGLDDDTYRDMLEAQTRTPQRAGKRSAADLTVGEGARVLDWLKRNGAVNPKAKVPDTKRRPVARPERAPMMAKIHALLAELGRVTGEPHGMAYADAVCKRNRWAECVDFARDLDLHLVIGALSRTLRHRQAQAEAQAGARQPAAPAAGE
jgi:phage gp16-like protein